MFSVSRLQAYDFFKIFSDPPHAHFLGHTSSCFLNHCYRFVRFAMKVQILDEGDGDIPKYVYTCFGHGPSIRKSDRWSGRLAVHGAQPLPPSAHPPHTTRLSVHLYSRCLAYNYRTSFGYASLRIIRTSSTVATLVQSSELARLSITWQSEAFIDMSCGRIPYRSFTPSVSSGEPETSSGSFSRDPSRSGCLG